MCVGRYDVGAFNVEEAGGDDAEVEVSTRYGSQWKNAWGREGLEDDFEYMGYVSSAWSALCRGSK